MKKLSVFTFAIMIGLGFYSLAAIIENGITLSEVMSLAGIIVVAVYCERHVSNNKGISLILEIFRDTLGGLGSLPILKLIPIEVSETIQIVTILASTAILAIAMSDDFIGKEIEDEEEEEE